MEYKISEIDDLLKIVSECKELLQKYGCNTKKIEKYRIDLSKVFDIPHNQHNNIHSNQHNNIYYYLYLNLYNLIL